MVGSVIREGMMKIKITLNLKKPQRIKYTNITTVTRKDNIQTKTVKKQTAGIILESGCNEVDIKVYHQIEKSPWFVLLVGRKDIVVDGVPVEKKKSSTIPKKKVVKPVTVEIKK